MEDQSAKLVFKLVEVFKLVLIEVFLNIFCGFHFSQQRKLLKAVLCVFIN